jgi:hypothetical protein
MSGIRTAAYVAIGFFGLLVGAVFIGDALIASGLVKNPDAYQTPAKIVFFVLFLAFGFSVIPLMVKLVLGFQVAIGNDRLRVVRAAVDHSAWIIGAMWAVMLLGLVVALPTAIREGFFANDSAPVSSEAQAAKAIANTPVSGTLVAAPGMQTSRMIAESTLRLRRGTSSTLFSRARFGGAAIFDYRVAGTATTFRRCRYYYVTTYTHDPARIEAINVGISAEKLTRPALDASERAHRSELRSAGWHSKDGRTWRRSNIVLDLRVRRLDEPIAGENHARAGEWIEFVELTESKFR